jgi:hypothetical protein
MLEFFSLNKNKNHKILLLHGLFASSGFWLPYIHRLKDFNIIIPNIDYQSMLISPEKNLQFILDQISKMSNFDYVLSHSFGTVLANKLKFDTRYYNVCPIYKSTRNDKQNFIKLISSSTKLTSDEIKKTLNMVDSLIDNDWLSANPNKVVNLYPLNDEYFNYQYDDNMDNIFFDGDHFEISKIFDCTELKGLPVC